MLEKIIALWSQITKTKTRLIGFIASVVALIVAIVLIIVLAVSNSNSKYHPSDDVLSIVNEAAIVTHGSQITGKYTQLDNITIDKKKGYLFEFKLKNGERASFAFAKNVTKTRNIYEMIDGKLVLVMLPTDNENRDVDNTGEWKDSWN